MSETIDTTDAELPEQPDPADPVVAVDAIKAQLAESERRYQASLNRERGAQQQVANVTEQLQTVQQERDASDFSSVANALDAAMRQSELVRDQIKAAGEAGDFGKVAELSVMAGRVGAEITQLEAGKREMEARRNQQLRQPEQQRQVQQVAPSGEDPIEADLSRRDARAAAWIREHKGADGRPLFYTDPAFQQRVIGADALARGNQIAPNSPEYFQFVERTVGLTNQQSGGGNAPRQVPQSAPVRQTATVQSRPRNDGHIPKEFVDHAVRVLDLTKREGGRKVPDQPAIAQAWAESRRMASTSGRDGYMVGDPWSNR